MTAVIASPAIGHWAVDTVHPQDGAALQAMFDRCSAATVQQRFFGRLPALPRRYLADVLAGRPEVHDAVVVRYGDGLHVAGLASLAAGPDAAELGVLVADDAQRRGLGAAMVERLVTRARDRGVDYLSASVLPGRVRLLVALGRRLPLVRLVASADGPTGVYRL